MHNRTDFAEILTHYKTNDPKIYSVLQKLDLNDWFKPWQEFRGDDYFTALCRAIIGQQLSVKAATSIYLRFADLFKPRIASPRDVLEIEDIKLREIGLSWSKVKYIKDLSQKVFDKDIDLQSLESLRDEEVIAELVKVKGIGRWTAEMFLMFNLHRENIFSPGDLGLKRGIEKLYNLTDPTPDQIEDIIKPTSPLPIEKKTLLNIMYTNTVVGEKFNEILKPYDLSTEQFNVLRILRGQKGNAVNRLASLKMITS